MEPQNNPPSIDTHTLLKILGKSKSRLNKLKTPKTNVEHKIKYFAGIGSE
jgi:hypothetical protein